MGSRLWLRAKKWVLGGFWVVEKYTELIHRKYQYWSEECSRGKKKNKTQELDELHKKGSNSDLGLIRCKI